MTEKYQVAIIKTAQLSYPKIGPFSPAKKYPEYKFQDLSSEGWVYEAVRETLRLLGLDEKNYNTPHWNPFVEIVKPGDKVVIKPNLVLDFNYSGQTTNCVITHASVLRPIVDYVLMALKGAGEVMIADSPHGNANFEIIKKVAGLNELGEFYKNVGADLKILDLRKYEYGFGHQGFLENRKTVNRDPKGYLEINLGKESAFIDLPHLENLYGADFDRREIRRYHNQNVNKYLVARTFLDTDVIISIPKLKTHKKIGTTLNLKGLIGINGDKNYLPHFRIGDPAQGGDEFPLIKNQFERRLRQFRRFLFDHLLGDNNHKRIKSYKLINYFFSILEGFYFKKMGQKKEINSGDWHGNQTVYRTAYDLSKIIFQANKSGQIISKNPRRFFSLIDGIVGGEKDGPLSPSPKPCGVLIAGHNFVAVDIVATRLMGFNPEKMPVFTQLRALPSDHPLKPVSPGDIHIISNKTEWNKNIFSTDEACLNFIPHHGWSNYLEIKGKTNHPT